MARTTVSMTTSPHAPRAHGQRRLTTVLQDWLTAHSVALLRHCLGWVILGFGALKFSPGASPAEGLVMRTTDALTFGVVDGRTAVVLTAVLEALIGLSLVTGRGLRPGLVVMAGWLVGIMTPVVLFPGRMFPDGLPTLEAQYVLKDLILVGAAAVVAASSLGARMVTEHAVPDGQESSRRVERGPRSV